MAKTTRNFSSAAGYKKWLAFGHMHGAFAKSPGNTPVKIRGKSHKVMHKGRLTHKMKMK